jgi:hypothetical protein
MQAWSEPWNKDMHCIDARDEFARLAHQRLKNISATLGMNY